MDQSVLIKIAIATVSVIGCGGFLAWFAKLMATRMIKQYDDNDKRIRDLEAAVAVLTYRADQAKIDLSSGLNSIRKSNKEKCS